MRFVDTRHGCVLFITAMIAVAPSSKVAATDTGPSASATDTASVQTVAMEAVERVRHRYRGGDDETFTERYPSSMWEERAAEVVRHTNCLAERFGAQLDDRALRRELGRIRISTRRPAMLEAITAELDHDLVALKEGLVRPGLARRWMHQRVAWDSEIQRRPREVASELARRLDQGLGWEDLDAEVIRVEMRVGEASSDVVFDRADGAYRRDVTAAEIARIAEDNRFAGGDSVIDEDERWLRVERLERVTPDSVEIIRGLVKKVAWDVWWQTERDRWSATPASRRRATDREPAVARRSGIGAVGQGPDVDPLEGSWEIEENSLIGRTRHASVWTGAEMIVFGGTLDASGRAPLRFDPLTDVWSVGSANGAPLAQLDPRAVWTGSEMLIWGGETAVPGEFTGGRYDPGLDTWTGVSQVGAPPEGADPTLVWTGDEALVWGGDPMCSVAYDPSTDVWRSISSVGAPANRSGHSAVWADSEMIVWGGRGPGGGLLQNGGRYNSATDQWTSMTSTGAPAAREGHLAAWVGTEMVVWGGFDDDGFVMVGGRYRPVPNIWVSLPTDDAPSERRDYSAVWTGEHLVVWGGAADHTSIPEVLGSGASYSPWTNRWLTTPIAGAPIGRFDHSAVWTGDEVIVWGGSRQGLLNSGGRFDPAAQEWVGITPGSSPPARIDHTATWTGAEMVVFGGQWNQQTLDDGGIYDPLLAAWEPTPVLDAPSGRTGHGEEWTGSEVIIWGGVRFASYGEVFTNTGRRFDPVTREWIFIPNFSAPSPRADMVVQWCGPYGFMVWGGRDADSYPVTGGFFFPHLDEWTFSFSASSSYARAEAPAVWTGREVVAWGGYLGSSVRDDGVRYDPVFNQMSAVDGSTLASSRWGHTAVWTGVEIAIFGGSYSTSSGYRQPVALNPADDSWRSIDMTGSLDLRRDHSAVWTGEEMVIWGGYLYGDLGSGVRWDADSGAWHELSTVGAPEARSHHTAVWTGDEMIVWGGSAGTELAFWSPVVEPVVSGPASVCAGESATLEVVEGYDSYLWWPGGQTQRQIVVSPEQTTVYRVEVTAGSLASSSTHRVTVGTDMNGDGDAGGADVELLVDSLFGNPGALCPDVDDNGDHDAADLSAWIVLADLPPVRF